MDGGPRSERLSLLNQIVNICDAIQPPISRNYKHNFLFSKNLKIIHAPTPLCPQVIVNKSTFIVDYFQSPRTIPILGEK